MAAIQAVVNYRRGRANCSESKYWSQKRRFYTKCVVFFYLTPMVRLTDSKHFDPLRTTFQIGNFGTKRSRSRAYHVQSRRYVV